MQEQWIKWEPVEGLGSKYYVESIYSNVESGFKMILSEVENNKNKVYVFFKYCVADHRTINGNFRNKIIDALREEYGSEFYNSWSFFKVNNSAYVKWVSEESYGTSDIRNFTHYSFIAENSIVDIITNHKVEVKIIDLP